MNIKISATHLDLTPALKDYVEKRMASLSKVTTGDPFVDVELSQTTHHHRQGQIFAAKVNVVTALGKQFRAVSEKADLYEAIDDVRSEIVRELSSAKDKRETLFRRGAKKVKNMIKGLRS